MMLFRLTVLNAPFAQFRCVSAPHLLQDEEGQVAHCALKAWQSDVCFEDGDRYVHQKSFVNASTDALVQT